MAQDASIPQPAPPPVAPIPDAANVQLTFPGTSVFEILAFYENLTGRRLIRDANLAGPTLTIVSPEPVTREQAVKLIESSLLLNGYTLVPVDDGTMKILGPSRAPRTEGLPLYSREQDLPTGGDQVVSFYRPLAFIAPDEAKAVLEQVIQTNPFGSVATVPNTNAIILTDKTPLIRKALSLVTLIDVAPAEVVTEFVQLERANAERIVETLEKMFEKDDSGKTSGPAAVQSVQAPADPSQPAPAAAGAAARYENRLLAGKAKFLADKRTNRVLVITRRENYRYVRDVIAQLDAAGSFEMPFVRVLNYVPVGDVFPVIVDMLADPDAEKETSSSPTPTDDNNDNTANQQNPGNFGGGNNNSLGGSGSLDRPDLLQETDQSAPQSATIGEIRLIGDNSANSIIVYGPPESKERARQILDLLDQRPKQVYLAVVIGQLRITNDLDYGVNYLIRYQGASGNGIAAAVLNPALFPGLTGTLPRPSSITGPGALTNGLQALSGLTVFGTIADSIDVYARFLESTNRFRTLSRPVIYTTNNRKATILSGQRVPVPTSTLTTATGGGNTGDGQAITSNIQYQDVVLKLEVIPLINSDREVNLVIAQTNDNIIGTDTISGNQVPRIATQKIETSVRVPNGSTVVLGGLITEEKDRTRTGIPYIGRLPVLGPLLGGRENNRLEKRELIVMIQPVVVDSNSEMLKAGAQEGDRSSLGRDAQALAAQPAEAVPDPRPWQLGATPKPRRTPNGQSR